jgi:hypothetical protein
LNQYSLASSDICPRILKINETQLFRRAVAYDSQNLGRRSSSHQGRFVANSHGNHQSI